MEHPRIPLYCVADSCQNLYTRIATAPATYPPHALGMILAYVQSIPLLRSSYFLVPKVIANEETLRSTFNNYGPGVYLFSNYLWTVRTNLTLSALAKQLSSRSKTIHGGPSMPKYEEAATQFFQLNDHVDIGVRGEGENTAAELLAHLASYWGDPDVAALTAVEGMTFREGVNRRIIRTPERVRERNLDKFPSPYLSGVYDVFEELPRSWTAAIIETNRGCPYGCTFCDWGSATLQKVLQFSLERIKREINWIASHKVSRLWIADANFGIYERDIAIAEMICEAKRDTGYPEQVIVNYAKNATSRLVEIVRRFNKAHLLNQGVISIQTHDPQVLRNIHRSNIKTERYEQLIDAFRSEGLPISSDLLIGLPGATLKSFKEDLQFFIDRQVHTIAYPLTVLPNSPMADSTYMQHYGIETDKSGFVTASKSFTSGERRKMMTLHVLYHGGMRLAILKYLLYFAQMERGVKMADFLLAFVERLLDPTIHTPVSSLVFLRHCANDDRDALLRLAESQWRELYREVLVFAAEVLNIPEDTATEAIVECQIAVLPRAGRELPLEVDLHHDLLSYWEQFRSHRNLSMFDGPVRPLKQFGPGKLRVSDPHGTCTHPYLPQTDFHIPAEWELASALTMAQQHERGPRSSPAVV
jgi:radical SAM superfamily enzyme YgiQ (UPF0313 family)